MKIHIKGGLRKWRNKSIIINFYVDRQEKVTTVAFSRIYLNVYLKDLIFTQEDTNFKYSIYLFTSFYVLCRF